MKQARWAIALVGILLPYLARVPGGTAWLDQYLSAGVPGFLLISTFNAIAWGSILLLSLLYRHVSSLVCPVVSGFGFLAVVHGTLDLAADAQAGVALVFIPFYALAFIAVGGALGYGYDRWLRRRDVDDRAKES